MLINDTGKMLLKASIVHILKAKRSMCLFNEHLYSIELHRFLFYLIAIAIKSYNVFMLKLSEVIELVLKLLMAKIGDSITKNLHSNMVTIFGQPLLKICC